MPYTIFGPWPDPKNQYAGGKVVEGLDKFHKEFS